MEEESITSHKTFPSYRNRLSQKISFCVLFVISILERRLINKNILYFSSFYMVSILRCYSLVVRTLSHTQFIVLNFYSYITHTFAITDNKLTTFQTHICRFINSHTLYADNYSLLSIFLYLKWSRNDHNTETKAKQRAQHNLWPAYTVDGLARTKREHAGSTKVDCTTPTPHPSHPRQIGVTHLPCLII
jgi:hypothetical protein